MTFDLHTSSTKSTVRATWLTRMLDGARSRARMTRVSDLPPRLREDIGLPRDTTYLNP